MIDHVLLLASSMARYAQAMSTISSSSTSPSSSHEDRRHRRYPSRPFQDEHKQKNCLLKLQCVCLWEALLPFFSLHFHKVAITPHTQRPRAVSTTHAYSCTCPSRSLSLARIFTPGSVISSSALAYYGGQRRSVRAVPHLRLLLLSLVVDLSATRRWSTRTLFSRHVFIAFPSSLRKGTNNLSLFSLF